MSILTPGQLARVRRFQEGGETTPEQPFVDSVQRVESRMDPTTAAFLFGTEDQPGFIPGAFRAAERTFFDEEGRPIVVPTEIAGFSPDQIRAMELARANIGIQQPFLEDAMTRYQGGIDTIREGFADEAAATRKGLEAVEDASRFSLDQRDRALLDAMGGTQEGRGRAIAAEERFRGDLDDISRQGVKDVQRFGMDLSRARRQGRRTYDEFGRDITDAVGAGMTEAERLRSGLTESEDLIRGTTSDFDLAAATQSLQDPFEDQVVQQMIQDATEGLAKQDMAQFARDVQTGGESAFGSRARLSAAERAEAMGRGLSKGVGALRSQGFQQAQQTAIAEDERKRQAARSAASGLAGLRSTEYGAGRDVADAMTGAAGAKLQAGRGFGDLIQSTAREQLGAKERLGSTLTGAAQSRFGAGTGLGATLADLGARDAAARRAAGAEGMSVASNLQDAYGRVGGQAARAGSGIGAAQMGFAGFGAGIGEQAQRAGATDVASLSGIGGMAQDLRQRELDAKRADLVQAQRAPLAQFQALQPFVGMVPAGTQAFTTNFSSMPSATQIGAGTGLASLGAFGNYMNPTATYLNTGQPAAQ